MTVQIPSSKREAYISSDRVKREMHPALEGWGCLRPEVIQMLKHLIQKLSISSSSD
jgi:hypothetical protein